MASTRRLLPLAVCFALCNATCWIEEQSTTPMRAYNVTSNVESYRMCVLYCGNDPKCVSASYSEATRVCHNQVPSTLPVCAVPPFRRFVRTMTGCIGDDLGVTYVRTDLSLEHGADPCVPATLLHADLVTLDAAGATPPCQQRRISNADGPVLYLRCLDGNGKYESYGIHNRTTFAYDAASNSFMVRYKPDFGATVTYLCISGFCAEEDPFDSECCAPLPPFTITTLTNPAPALFNTAGACPGGQSLYATVYSYRNYVWVRGSSARIFCAGGFWLVGDDEKSGLGQTFRITSASCAD